MNNALYKLVYISRNQIQGNAITLRAEIEQILATSRVNNLKSDITGALMFNAGCFAQVLEGPHDKIQETFETIQCDTRHAHTCILVFEPIAERSFSKWAMAYHGNDSNAALQFSDITLKSGFDANQLNGEHIYDLIKEHLLSANLSI
ncbi:BLUF domain-containing protein [Methylomonas sp. AM2-LC]|uniref:BLUF domain-containing protein n=1 Tax=Methylomonas sp. AM2-LC TaxID=3153301 RepID=UPI0032648210